MLRSFSFFVITMHVIVFGSQVLNVMAADECPQCSGEVVVLTDTVFSTECECVGTQSITAGPDVIVKMGANVAFKSPHIRLLPGFNAESGSHFKTSMKPTHVVFAWNDLGMHCLNPTYNAAVILPPYNTLWACVVRKDSPPQIVTQDSVARYTVIGNTYSYGKRSYGQFWDNSQVLFGIVLLQNTGLNLVDSNVHNGLSGLMLNKNDHFQADGIPVTPVNDALIWSPYQIAEVTVKNLQNDILAQTRATLPTSDDINCAKCHGNDAFNDILEEHDDEHSTDLMNQKPVLCAECHGSPALGSTSEGSSGKYLSQAIHESHADRNAVCYDCHPGKMDQCNRSLAHTSQDGNCITCHGTMAMVAGSIESGVRIPWADEPKCISCHVGIPEVDTGDTLYRNARGHGGLYCATCHGSPHAMIPTSQATDNYQAVQYQGKATTIGSCGACHEDSRGEEEDIAQFPEKHGGTNPEEVTSCHICHTTVPSVDKTKWPHAYAWKNR